ncbi:hypothetical protein Taro_034891 [Colocasia esculenta]|uniref:Uncharacterized protein n=1 Tax=Colocasia esculenta TaxID=4460 RepID=A0A843W472_COLES|nr:hypothetical protein [Colocasia esculenta]
MRQGTHRVLNTTALVVVFMLPLFGGLRLHGYRVSCTGQSADVGLGKATVSYVTFKSRCRAASRLMVFLTCSRREDIAWSGGDAVPCVVSVFFVRVWCWLISTVLWLVLVERQLDLSSMTARLRVVVAERRLTGCGLTHVVFPVVGTIESRYLYHCVMDWYRCSPSCYLVCGFRHIVVWGYNRLALGQRFYYSCVWGSLVKLIGPKALTDSLPVNATGSADVGLGKATASYIAFRLRHRAASRSQLLCVFKEVLAGQSWGKLCSARGSCCGVGYPRFCVSQAHVFVVLGVCPSTCVVPSRSVSSVLDTLTPVFELYVRLRERRQREATCARHGPAVVCGLQMWCWLVSTVLWLVLVEWQLDLSFVIARLRVVVGERRLTGCGLTYVVCPVVGTIESRLSGSGRKLRDLGIPAQNSFWEAH